MNPNTITNTKKIYILLIWLIIVIAIVIISALLLDYFKIISLQKTIYNLQHNSTSSTKLNQLTGNQDKIIARVGSENIYRKDLDTEISAYPKLPNQNIDKSMLQKLVKDSIILQAAQKEHWVSLDESVFNTPEKDYPKRLRIVSDVKKIYDNKQNIIKGTIISIWFHNMVPAEIGYEAGKKIAFNKITSLHNDIKSKRISIPQAGQSIIDDKSLSRVDKSFASNAIMSFRAGENEQISFDTGFDKIIRTLEVGEVSEIFLAKDYDENKNLIDAVYMFARVDEISADGNKQPFEEWYSQIEKKYEVLYY